MTALAGLPVYLDFIYKSGLYDSIRKQVKIRNSGQGWTDVSVPSPSSVFRYLQKFHNKEEEIKRKAHKAFIPKTLQKFSIFAIKKLFYILNPL